MQPHTLLITNLNFTHRVGVDDDGGVHLSRESLCGLLLSIGALPFGTRPERATVRLLSRRCGPRLRPLPSPYLRAHFGELATY